MGYGTMSKEHNTSLEAANSKHSLYRWVEFDGEVRYVTEEEHRIMTASLDDIFKELDKLVTDSSSISYQFIKRELTLRTKIKANPFFAGRPKKYDQEDKENVIRLRKEGKTIREISKQTGISTGKVSAILNDVQ